MFSKHSRLNLFLAGIELRPATSTRTISIKILVDGREEHRLLPVEKGQPLIWQGVPLPW
jgi:hypothetical protein